MKNVQPLLLFVNGDSCLPSLTHSLCILVWNIFSLWKRTLYSTFDFQSLCIVKERPIQFVFKHKQVVEEAKMLIKLISVDSDHFIRCKCKITHCLDSQTSEYISTIVLDDKKRHSINEVLEFLSGVGTFTNNTSSLFDTQGLQFVTMNELKRSMPGVLQLFLLFTW